MTDVEIKRAICLHTVAIIEGLEQLSDQTAREACIYPTLCLIKEAQPEAFENALVFYLRNGVAK